MIWYLKAVVQEVSKEEQVLYVIWALPNENNNWRSYKLIMDYNERIQAFDAISENLEMEEEHLKLSIPSNVAFITRANKPKGNRRYHSK